MRAKGNHALWITALVVLALLNVCVATPRVDAAVRAQDEVSRVEILLRAARNQANAGNYSKAAQYYVEALQVKDSPAVHKELAGVLIKDKRLAEAEEHLGDLIHEDEQAARWLVGGYMSADDLVSARSTGQAQAGALRLPP